MINKKSHIILVLIFILLSTIFLISPIFFGDNVGNELPVLSIFPHNTYKDTLHVVADVDYAPYSYIDENGNFSGHDIELITEVANTLKVNLDVKLMPWGDALKAVQAGEADVVLGADVLTEDYNSYLIMTIPLSSEAMTVFGRGKVHSAEELYGKRIAIVECNGVSALLKSYRLNAYCLSYSSYSEAFKSVKSGSNDYVVSNYSVGKSVLRKLNMTDLRSTGFVIMKNYLCFGVNKNRPELLKIINDALIKLSKNGDAEHLQKKWIESEVSVQSLTEYFDEHRSIVEVYVGSVFVLILVYFVFILIGAKNKEKSLRRQAEMDPLTGVLNRGSAENQICKLVANNVSNATLALFIIDIDNFKGINDQLGHQEGDLVLKTFACTLRRSFRANDVVGRLGGDEFVVLMRDIQDKKIAVVKGKEICDVVSNFYCNKNLAPALNVSISVGIAICPDDGKSFPELYTCADEALYYIKKHGRNGAFLYEDIA